MDIRGLLISWLVTSVSFIIISKMPTGIEIQSFKQASIAALVFGFLNAIGTPILIVLTLPLTILTLGLFLLLINPIIFALASKFVPGFNLRWGFWSAIIGSFLLSLVNSIIYEFLKLLTR